MANVKSDEAFRDHAREIFAFLSTDFGFLEESVPENQNNFAIWLSNATTRVVIESISWGWSARVALGKAGSQGAFENYDLLDFIAVLDPKETTLREHVAGGNPTDLELLAKALGRYGEIVLRGDFHLFPQIDARIKQRGAAWKANHGLA